MKYHYLVAAVLLFPTTALAQYFRPQSPGPALAPLPQPRVTPYLGLLNGGNPAANYYLLVQPEVKRGIDTRVLSSGFADIGSLAPARSAEEADELLRIPVQPQSGHYSGFLVANPYFTFPTRQRSYLPFGGRQPDALPAPKTEKKTP